MLLPDHKTKIVCTIGPASSSEAMLKDLILYGMNVARLNFSHGDLEGHREVIHKIRKLSSELDVVVSIMADLPGPKIRIGKLKNEPIHLKKDDKVTLTTENIEGDESVIPVNYSKLSESVKPGRPVYLNDGFIQLNCLEVSDKSVDCTVVVGGPLSSNKGMNLPGSRVFLEPVTETDLNIVDFALNEGVDIFSVSFIEKADDIQKIRNHAKVKGKSVFIVSKIEREEAVKNINEILNVTDGLMIARGDLGVEIPIQNVPNVQKELTHKANLLSIPVITATQMLESMTENIRPTRAEVTDVANAILDGTDAVMLSGETAAGKYPVETVSMMTKIAREIEFWRSKNKDRTDTIVRNLDNIKMDVDDVISLQVNDALQKLPIKYVVTPTVSGESSRHISRFKSGTWILAFSRYLNTGRNLAFSYGVYPIYVGNKTDSWETIVVEKLKQWELVRNGDYIVLTQGQSPGKPGGTNLLKIISIT
ncbi:pyruvate kinase [Methanohalobium evestigatum Z-7303]|uniref:Pyruvate kinase n=1 Tax=Methanohalobium evestigatum (strain ATCC BAA-1072 / DSM 3721 / NBRC 107634 / OCM 161 / Z-7303) TaxID=644295 RepID=D7E9W3_METEZ|nr:pyruvate kinase [Methanohalobium evestigatum]ADI74385.1 pyruvate kinase [Methanohalobium evestigatum Z-7303]